MTAESGNTPSDASPSLCFPGKPEAFEPGSGRADSFSRLGRLDRWCCERHGKWLAVGVATHAHADRAEQLDCHFGRLHPQQIDTDVSPPLSVVSRDAQDGEREQPLGTAHI